MKDFAPYEQALELKELGFDEPCFACVDEDGVYLKGDIRFNSTIQSYAPLYQQAFRWFREKHSLFHNIWNYTHGEPTDLVPNGFTYSIDEDWITIIGKKENGYFEKYYNTYEEAESACLDKLIEITQTKT